MDVRSDSIWFDLLSFYYQGLVHLRRTPIWSHRVTWNYRYGIIATTSAEMCRNNPAVFFPFALLVWCANSKMSDCLRWLGFGEFPNTSWQTGASTNKPSAIALQKKTHGTLLHGWAISCTTNAPLKMSSIRSAQAYFDQLSGSQRRPSETRHPQTSPTASTLERGLYCRGAGNFSHHNSRRCPACQRKAKRKKKTGRICQRHNSSVFVEKSLQSILSIWGMWYAFHIRLRWLAWSSTIFCEWGLETSPALMIRSMPRYAKICQDTLRKPWGKKEVSTCSMWSESIWEWYRQHINDGCEDHELLRPCCMGSVPNGPRGRFHHLWQLTLSLCRVLLKSSSNTLAQKRLLTYAYRARNYNDPSEKS